jgi:hypothetical protein
VCRHGLLDFGAGDGGYRNYIGAYLSAYLGICRAHVLAFGLGSGRGAGLDSVARAWLTHNTILNSLSSHMQSDGARRAYGIIRVCMQTPIRYQKKKKTL